MTRFRVSPRKALPALALASVTLLLLRGKTARTQAMTNYTATNYTAVTNYTAAYIASSQVRLSVADVPRDIKPVLRANQSVSWDVDNKSWRVIDCPAYFVGTNCGIDCKLCRGHTGTACGLGAILERRQAYTCRCAKGYYSRTDYAACEVEPPPEVMAAIVRQEAADAAARRQKAIEDAAADKIREAEEDLGSVWVAPQMRLDGLERVQEQAARGACWATTRNSSNPNVNDGPSPTLKLVTCGSGKRSVPIVNANSSAGGISQLLLFNPTAKPLHNKSAPVVWLYLTGHARTLLLNAPRLKSFLSRMTPNWFVSISVWDEIDTTWETWWGNLNPGVTTSVVQLKHMLADVMCAFDGRAVIETVHRGPDCSCQDSSAQTHLWVRVHHLAQQGRRVMGSATSDETIIVKSRPDIVFSHALDAIKLATYFMHRDKSKTAFLLQHSGTNVPAENDPNYAMWLTSAVGYQTSVDYWTSTRLKVADASGQSDTYESFIIAGSAGGDAYEPMSTAYLRPDFRIMYHRLPQLDGETEERWCDGADLPAIQGDTALIVPFGKFSGCPIRLDEPVPNFVLDVTQGLMCIVGRRDGPRPKESDLFAPEPVWWDMDYQFRAIDNVYLPPRNKSLYRRILKMARLTVI